MTHRLRRIAVTAAVLPLVVLVGLRSAWAAYACRVDRQVRAACCCPPKDTSSREPVGDGPRVQANACCDVTLGESRPPPDARTSDSQAPDAAPSAMSSVALAVPLPAVRPGHGPLHLARPPPPEVPIYLANRSILL